MASYHQPGDWLTKVLPYKERIKDLDMVLTVGTSQFPFFDFLPKDRLRFVPHGIDTDYYCPANCRNEDSRRVFCLTVGHWLRDFDALEQVIRSAPEQLVFRIVAGQEHVKQFRSLANVELYSGVADDELLRLYQRSDIGLMPLQDSTANNGILEMMACGLPIVTTRVGSVHDYLPEGTGILIDGNDPMAFLSAIKRLADSPVERGSLGEAARCRALELDWANIARQMAEIYHGL
jgi:glycosyltransferase involved in cell wall biosynthesis